MFVRNKTVYVTFVQTFHIFPARGTLQNPRGHSAHPIDRPPGHVYYLEEAQAAAATSLQNP
jgi:hypothetical protein